MSPKLITIEGAARLARAGIFADHELIGVTEFGYPIHNSHNTIVVRMGGPRADAAVAPVALGCYADPAEEAKALKKKRKKV